MMDKKTELAINLGQTIYNNTIRDMQAKIDAQAAEIKALRKFIRYALEIDLNHYPNPNNILHSCAYQHRLVEKNGKPTKLLTGEASE